MGATNIYHEVNGNSMSEAYESAVEDCLHMYGNDCYNGTISTTEGFVDKTQRFKNNHGGDMNSFEKEALDNTQKWDEVWGVDMGEGKYVFIGWAAE